MKVIILLGRQGSGKGTQADLLKNEFGYTIIGSGEILRAFYESSTFSAAKAKAVMNAGGYVPTPVIFRLWMDKLEAIKDEGVVKGIIIDGSPRKILEAQLLDQALEWYEWGQNTKIILVDISREEAFERLTKRRICEKCKKVFPWVGEAKSLQQCDRCGGKLITRPDDTPDAINQRLDLFESETMPVVEYYKKADKVQIVDGSGTIQEVYASIKALV